MPVPGKSPSLFPDVVAASGRECQMGFRFGFMAMGIGEPKVPIWDRIVLGQSEKAGKGYGDGEYHKQTSLYTMQELLPGILANHVFPVSQLSLAAAVSLFTPKSGQLTQLTS